MSRNVLQVIKEFNENLALWICGMKTNLEKNVLNIY